jgi:hypothetical protein
MRQSRINLWDVGCWMWNGCDSYELCMDTPSGISILKIKHTVIDKGFQVIGRCIGWIRI